MKAGLSAHKTKIVATIGPASESPEMLARLIRAGMDVARLNFSHGNPSKHAEIIPRIRDAAREIGRRVAIMADLPGPKLRLGKIDPEPIQLLPGVDLGISAFTQRDRNCLEFALKQGVDAVGQSFVERAADIHAVRAAAAKIGAQPFVIAKIERADALAHFDEILAAVDGIMVARGDLGVEVPIEEIACTQKQLIAKANLAGQPVITATQMLESMVSSRLPTRAEATDVANAILDGTDCVMLSGESAVGKFPEEAVTMLAKIATFTETRRQPRSFAGQREFVQQPADASTGHRMASVVEHALETVPCDLLLVPTRGGTVARAISRFKPPVWIVAPSPDSVACQNLAFSYGVHAVHLAEEPDDWREWITDWVRANGISAARVMLVAGPSPRNPKANYRIELMRLDAHDS